MRTGRDCRSGGGVSRLSSPPAAWRWRWPSLRWARRRSTARRARRTRQSRSTATCCRRRRRSSAARSDNAAQSKPYWPMRVVPPKGAPNILLIMTDDVGFGAPSTFGGVIPTPALDRIAKDGLRYTNFHSTALCSPTRAALITGRNHHSVGFGVVSEGSTGFPGYNSVIGRDSATIGRFCKRERLPHRVVWQGPQYANLPNEPGGAVRPMADRHGLRLFLRLHRRRHEPVGAEPLPQHDGDLPLRRA